jgi:Flp pilus assembly protein TadG
MIRARSAGQSTVEFTLMMMLMMGFVLFFLQISLVFGYGNYVHYATFMSARALLAGGENADDQQNRAQNYMALMLKQSVFTPAIERFPSIAKGQGGTTSVTGMSINLPDYDPNVADSSWSQGIRYTFQSRIFPLPLGGGEGTTGAASSTITLKSESWLGREVTTEECVTELRGRDPHGKGIFDNGC